VDTGSREENASKQKLEPPFRFNRTEKPLAILHRDDGVSSGHSAQINREGAHILVLFSFS
jgi:hypothetical protein